MTKNDNQRALRVLQLTDPHLMADPAGELLGVNTRESLDAVIAMSMANRTLSAPPVISPRMPRKKPIAFLAIS